MRSKDGFTPIEMAYAAAIGLLANYHHLRDDPKETPAFNRRLNVQLAKLHNRLLDESGLDGLYIEVEEKETRRPDRALDTIPRHHGSGKYKTQKGEAQ